MAAKINPFLKTVLQSKGMGDDKNCTVLYYPRIPAHWLKYYCITLSGVC